ncbi:MAG: hypothetical protein AAF229_12845 [Pseudomonadota bacterium]
MLFDSGVKLLAVLSSGSLLPHGQDWDNSTDCNSKEVNASAYQWRQTADFQNSRVNSPAAGRGKRVSGHEYRFRVNAVTVVAAAAFAGGNVFIGLSMGAYWRSLDPLVFMEGFWSQFTTFLFTIMPLFVLTLLGLALSARLDWSEPRLRRLWIAALGCFTVLSLITLTVHLPENLRFRAGAYDAVGAASALRLWLIAHVPRVALAFAIPVLAISAIVGRHELAERRLRMAVLEQSSE